VNPYLVLLIAPPALALVTLALWQLARAVSRADALCWDPDDLPGQANPDDVDFLAWERELAGEDA
jgi:hypothetical protein